ncbi:threonine synthase [Prosthecochloris sp. GSB1]|uniref:threonine synthase n=1 Tax=Prosthecochloris sp. GSB1 TaxID=281093 RepID=UPI000B8CCEDA|nr:threonine synthase [Prosthecochloris sp. GSB1]ASQ89739.1 threonine synthase [Prosthecochloris sp. GSB1]
MIFYSTNKKTTPATLKKATLEGLASDGGLYVPAVIPVFSEEEKALLRGAPFKDIAFAIAKKFASGEIEDDRLADIVEKSFDFNTPIIPLDNRTYVEELFNGPTLAFKDYGARFLARLTGYFAAQENKLITILVATSGDTGSAVAYGFRDVANTRVVLLYPSGKVSRLQEQQLTTVGGNVTALEVDGDFDDCQRLVKQAFMDGELRQRLTLTSANSINVSRLIPQSFYYAWASMQLEKKHDGKQPVFSVPSGNYGNLTAGVLAKKMGFPIACFVAASNANDSVTRYLEDGRYEPRPTVGTLSTAMDVGNPSNFARLRHFYDGDYRAMGRDISGHAVSDAQTLETIRSVYDRFGYIMDPHTAVGYAGLEAFRASNPEIDGPGVVLSTAHPAKFIESIKKALGMDITIPDRLQDVLDRQKISIEIGSDYRDLETFLTHLDSGH